MIQGLGSDSRGWALQRMAFRRRFRCIAVDNRGVGGDRRCAPPVLARPDGAPTRSRCSTPRASTRAHVMGASMGGAIAQILAVNAPRPRCARSSSRARRAATPSGVASCSTEWAEAVERNGACRRWRGEGLRWLVGPRLQRRFGVWLNLMARIVLQRDARELRRPGRGDPRGRRRRPLRARGDPCADARDHRAPRTSSLRWAMPRSCTS